MRRAMCFAYRSRATRRPTWLVRISARTAEPRLPPMVRTMALSLVAMPVCDAGTDSMMVSVLAAWARPMPMPLSAPDSSRSQPATRRAGRPSEPS